jgi:WD40 repeat protein
MIAIATAAALSSDSHAQEAKPRTVLKGNSGKVGQLVFSRDGKLLASVTFGKEPPRIWDPADGSLKAKIGVDYAFSIAFSPDSATVAVGTFEGELVLWDLANNKCRSKLKAHKELDAAPEAARNEPGVKTIAYSADGRWLATGGRDGIVRLWDADTAKERVMLVGHKSYINAVVFSSDGKWLASAGDDDSVRIWDVTLAKTIQTLDLSCPVRLALSGDGKRLAARSGSRFRETWIWDTSSREKIAAIKGSFGGISFGRDVLLALGGTDGAVHVWDVARNQEIALLRGHKGHVSAVAVSPDGGTIASGGFDETILLWDAPRRKR